MAFHFITGGQTVKRSLIDLLFPPKCVACSELLDKADVPFCSRCCDALSWVTSPLCPRCGLSLTVESDRDSLCGECGKEKRPFRRARALFMFHGVVQDAIYRLKYERNANVAPPLGAAMARYLLEQDFKDYDFIVPVPLHPKRLRERMFNPAQLLAKEIHRRLSIPLESHLLRRVRATFPQVDLPRRERLRNVRGAFQVVRKELFVDKRLLLIDDVWTTGATSEACSRALLQAGASSVDVLTLARTELS